MDDHAQNQIVVVAAANALVDEAYVLKRRLGFFYNWRFPWQWWSPQRGLHLTWV